MSKLFAKCQNCNKKYTFFDWEKKSGKYCSQQCYHNRHKGSLHHNWKEKVGYAAIHVWVHRNFGFPRKCEHCKIHHESNRKIHWANISGNYTRERNDWKRLCVSCHKIFDLNKKII